MTALRVGWGQPSDSVHTLYKELLEIPPEGVEYVFPSSGDGATKKGGPVSIRGRVMGSAVFRSVYDPLMTKCLDGPSLACRLASAVRSPRLMGSSETDWGKGFDLFHSNGNGMVENIPLIVRNDVRWVVDFEHVGSLFGYWGDWRKRIYRPRAREVLRKQLSSRYCRKLMPWTEAARRTVEGVLPFKEVSEKVEVVRLAIRPAPARPKDLPAHDAVRILFTGSVNYGGEFWSKGGHEVLESFARLRERYGEAVELVFRCWMPEELSSKYGSLPGMRHIPGALPKDELDRLFHGCDIFLFPSHNTPGMAILEAMRFGLPVVAKDIWANREQVKDGVTGFLVRPSDEVPYCLSPGEVPNWSMDGGPFLPHMRKRDERVISDLVSKLSELVESASLRQRMGVEASKVVEEGEASIGVRNRALRRIYEESSPR